MATAKTTTSALLTELHKFAANIKDLPYDQLMGAAAEAGWNYRLTQRSVSFAPTNDYMVDFDVSVGKDGVFEPLDTLTIAIDPTRMGPALPVSLAARFHASVSLHYLFFGRLPPQAPSQSAEAINVRVPPGGGNADVVIPGEAEQEYVDDGAATTGFEPIKVVDHFEPDGVPIFVDLYALGEKSSDVIEDVLSATDDFLERAQSVETINAMGTKNPMMIKFIKDLGTPEDSAALMDMITRRRNLVAPPVLSNARRRTAAQAN